MFSSPVGSNPPSRLGSGWKRATFPIVFSRRLLLSFALVISCVVARAADSVAPRYSRPEVRKELMAVVEKQLAAFRANDFAAAYALAAKDLRSQFTLKQFEVMLARGYPVIVHNRRADFGLPMDDGMVATLPVKIVAADGATIAYRYTLVKEPGGWRITGVRSEKPRASDA